MKLTLPFLTFFQNFFFFKHFFQTFFFLKSLFFPNIFSPQKFLFSKHLFSYFTYSNIFFKKVVDSVSERRPEQGNTFSNILIRNSFSSKIFCKHFYSSKIDFSTNLFTYFFFFTAKQSHEIDDDKILDIFTLGRFLLWLKIFE